MVNINYINVYNQLNWEGFTVGSSTFQLTGVQAHSGENVAAWSLDSTTIGGHPNIATINAEYPGSETESFDLHSFWYGCAAPTLQGAVSVPIACTITVNGCGDNDQVVATQDVDYEPSSLQDEMVLATLGDAFTGLKRVEFSTTPAIVGLIDDVSYSAHLE